jgi:hypothetical protein
MKRCFKCGESRPAEEFYPHPRMADGRLGKCKLCAKSDVAVNRSANLERIRAYDRGRIKLPHRKALRSALVRTERREYPERHRARLMVYRAVRNGTLTRRPCERCGAVRVEGHHDDYGKPLAVRWLCASHHRLADRGLL